MARRTDAIRFIYGGAYYRMIQFAELVAYGFAEAKEAQYIAHSL